MGDVAERGQLAGNVPGLFVVAVVQGYLPAGSSAESG
jgi:hypothetical protein